MTKRYDEIMDHVEVSPEMKNRILSNIEQTDLSPLTEIPEQKNSKNRTRFRIIGSVAACAAAVMIASAAVIPRFFRAGSSAAFSEVYSFQTDVADLAQTPSEESPEAITDEAYSPYAEEYTSLTEAQEQAGFPLKDITALSSSNLTSSSSTDAASTDGALSGIVYLVYREGAMVETEYEVNGQTVYFRQAPGTEDISGDSTEYETVQAIEVEGLTGKQENGGESRLTITVKGSGELFTLATWTDGDYSYSLQVPDGIDLDTLKEWIRSIQ